MQVNLWGISPLLPSVSPLVLSVPSSKWYAISGQVATWMRRERERERRQVSEGEGIEKSSHSTESFNTKACATQGGWLRATDERGQWPTQPSPSLCKCLKGPNKRNEKVEKRGVTSRTTIKRKTEKQKCNSARRTDWQNEWLTDKTN